MSDTSADMHGQVYMSGVNWTLMVAAVSLVLAFRSSCNLAAAYGVAVNSTMAITTILAFNVARERGGWSRGAALTLLVGFLAITLAFLGSNLMTIPGGGWLPLLIGSLLFTIMVTWRRGATILEEQVAGMTPTLQTFIGRAKGENIPRVPGQAVYFTGRLDQTPPSLLKLVRHRGVLHETVVVLTVVIESVPATTSNERIELTQMAEGFYRIVLHYGFMQSPNEPSDLRACAEIGLTLQMDEVHYVVGAVDLLAGRKKHGMALWRDKLFAFMAHNTQDITGTYQLPVDQLVTVGLRVGI